MQEIEVGSIVLSIAGRDKGRFFVVYEIVDDNYITIVDGALRKLEKAKLKKIKHVKNQNIVLERLQNKFKEGIKVYDAEVRSALKPYNG
ncbi:MAG TPA: hypothetical protein GX709_02760 [Clostridiales bacterium]|nr:hypothetical protein [Clostridiales bacterium]